MKAFHAIVVAGIVGLVPGLALAQAAKGQPPSTGDESARAADPSLDERRTEQATRRDARRHCLRETGSQLRPRHTADRCVAYGNVWTREDLARTGYLDIANALRTLDASIR